MRVLAWAGVFVLAPLLIAGTITVFGAGGPEPGGRVLGRALAEDADHRPVGLGELHPERGGQAEAQAASRAEVVAAGPREPQLVAERQRARGRLQHDDPVLREDARQR